MKCTLAEDILIFSGIPPGNYRVMVQDAFGNKRISENIDVGPLPLAPGTNPEPLTVPLDFIDDWIDLGAQLTFTVLDQDNNAMELNLGNDLAAPDPEAPPITCILLIFATDGATVVK
jgi:hypothetical protein